MFPEFKLPPNDRELHGKRTLPCLFEIASAEIGPYKNAWIIRAEVPEDDGTDTGRYFATLHEIVDYDHFGEPICHHEQTGESVLLENEEEVDKFSSRVKDLVLRVD